MSTRNDNLPPTPLSSNRNLRWDDNHFTLGNLPYGIGSTKRPQRLGVVTRFYSHVYFLQDLIENKLLGPLPDEIINALSLEDIPTLNTFASLPKSAHLKVREGLHKVFSDHTTGSLSAEEDAKLLGLGHLAETVTLHLPISIGDFSDFSCSRDHVLNASEAVMGVRKLPPGFLHFPVGYTGRSSSIVPSGTDIRRPWGQIKSKDSDSVVFSPSEAVDFELEVAAIISKPTALGSRVRIEDADEYIFGLVLLNDWSARDIQGFEMNPLGPFNGKSFGTTISPWVIPLEALRPFECPGPQRDIAMPTYLQDPRASSQYSVQLQVDLFPHGQSKPTTVCRSRLEWMYYSFRDLVAHQTVNGCPLRTGDLLATGTVSGSDPGTHGCLLEITKGGKQSLELESGQKRVYLEDGDAVRLTAWAGELGKPDCVGFGEAYGVLISAVDT